MLTAETLQALQTRGQISTPEALAFFDELEPVDLTFMTGRWRGSELPTNHPIDGLLEVANWYGKEFESPDCVHPLLMLDARQQVYKMAPDPLLFKLSQQISFPKSEALKPLYTFLSMLLKTDESQARLRMMEYRGKTSATMIYDALPIHDVFRKVSDRTVLGLMDYKHAAQPFFFVLQRDTP